MRWQRCDTCLESTGYSAGNPFVEMRVPRPSNPAEMTCVMAGHAKCFSVPVDTLPRIGASGGTATPEQWLSWIDSPAARRAGFTDLG